MTWDLSEVEWGRNGEILLNQTSRDRRLKFDLRWKSIGRNPAGQIQSSPYTCKPWDLRMVFMLLNGWKKEEEEKRSKRRRREEATTVLACGLQKLKYLLSALLQNKFANH